MTEGTEANSGRASAAGNPAGDADSQADNASERPDDEQEGADLNEDAQALKDELEKITVDVPSTPVQVYLDNKVIWHQLGSPKLPSTLTIMFTLLYM